MKILIIDDHTTTLEMFQELFTMLGHEVTTLTHPPSEPIPITFDLALLDCHYQDQQYFLEGIDYLPQIQSRSSFFFTGNPDRNFHPEAVALIDGIIQKPIEIELMQELLTQLETGDLQISSSQRRRWKRKGIILQERCELQTSSA